MPASKSLSDFMKTSLSYETACKLIDEAKQYLNGKRTDRYILAAMLFSESLSIAPSYEGYLQLGTVLNKVAPTVEIDLSGVLSVNHSRNFLFRKDYSGYSRVDLMADFFRQAREMKPNERDVLYRFALVIESGAAIMPEDLEGTKLERCDHTQVDAKTLAKVLYEKILTLDPDYEPAKVQLAHLESVSESKMPPAAIAAIAAPATTVVPPASNKKTGLVPPAVLPSRSRSHEPRTSVSKLGEPTLRRANSASRKLIG